MRLSADGNCVAMELNFARDSVSQPARVKV